MLKKFYILYGNYAISIGGNIHLFKTIIRAQKLSFVFVSDMLGGKYKTYYNF